MSPKSQLLLGIEISLVACFGIAVVEGRASLRPTGLVIEKLADDRIGGTVLIVAVCSGLMSSLSLATFLRFRRREDACIFSLAIATAILAVSAIANVPDGFSMNGTSPTIVTYPLVLWLICLIAILVKASLTSQRPSSFGGVTENAPSRSNSEPSHR